MDGCLPAAPHASPRPEAPHRHRACADGGSEGVYGMNDAVRTGTGDLVHIEMNVTAEASVWPSQEARREGDLGGPPMLLGVMSCRTAEQPWPSPWPPVLCVGAFVRAHASAARSQLLAVSRGLDPWPRPPWLHSHLHRRPRNPRGSSSHSSLFLKGLEVPQAWC